MDTKITKNEVEINMNDYCQKVSSNEMEIKSDDKQYVFRCQGIQSIDKMVEEVNTIIRQHFKLGWLMMWMMLEGLKHSETLI